MPKAKERKPDDKIKNQGKRKGGRPVQDQARRVMTAKMRKELAQQKRSASGSTGEAARETSPTAEAVEQVEQTAGAAVHETGQQTKQGVSKAVTKAKQERRKIKERQEQPKEKDQPPELPAPETPEAPALELDRPAPREQDGRTPPRSRPQPTGRTNTGPAAPKEKPASPVCSRVPRTRPASGPEALAIPKVRPAGTPADPPVPRTRTAGTRPAPIHAEPWTADKPPAPSTPGERMRDWAVEKRRKQAQEHRQAPAPPEYGGPPPASHYGKSPAAPGSSVPPKETPCMIVKNEEDVLERCLESAVDLVDEIIVVDTGSTDRTKEIAGRFTDQIYDFPWCDDFAAARNESFSHASMDYCMWLDADDVLLEEDQTSFLALKERLDPAVSVVMAPYHTGFDENGRVTFSYYRERLIKNRTGMSWVGAVHEVVTPVGTVLYGDFAVTHHKTRPSDPDRNLRIYQAQLDAGKELEPRQQFYYGRELYYHHSWEEALAVFERFLEEGRGWVRTTSTPAATAPTVIRSWAMTRQYWRRCFAPLPMTGPGLRSAATSASGSSRWSSTGRQPTGTPWP